jgi:hypothetical protein
MPTRKHFVVFFSPGTLFSETSRKPIDAWDVPRAAAMAKDITERHGARPYAFRFATDLVADSVPDGEGGTLNVTPKEIDKSGMHYLDGQVLRYEDVPETETILRSNMRCNDYPLVVETRNGYRHTDIFHEDAVLVNAEGEITDRGDNPLYLGYRIALRKEWAEALPA